MKCCICQEQIEVRRDEDGKVIWDKGNNALPVKEGRCCDFCNAAVVLPQRIINHRMGKPVY